MYSVHGDLKEAGFPHSEICGSAPICRLPAAYRRLSRPSSPVIAKASTTCTYSLDPITLPPRLTQSRSRAKSPQSRSHRQSHALVRPSKQTSSMNMQYITQLMCSRPGSTNFARCSGHPRQSLATGATCKRATRTHHLQIPNC